LKGRKNGSAEAIQSIDEGVGIGMAMLPFQEPGQLNIHLQKADISSNSMLSILSRQARMI
jgi:hypothetical protein